MSSLEAGSPLGGERPDATLSEFDRKVAAALNNPTVFMLLLQEFKDYLVQYGVLNQPPIPISQIFGFTQFNPQFDSKQDAGVETTTSTTYVDLTTVGPSITGLSAGEYLILYAAVAKNSIADQAARMSVGVNAVAASDVDAAETQVVSYSSISGFALKSLTDTNNTVTAKYRTSSGTASFYRRRLIALKVANA